MQFLQRLIEMLDGFGAMAAKITFGVSHQIVPGVLNLFDRFADYGMRSLRYRLRTRRNKHRSRQNARQAVFRQRFSEPDCAWIPPKKLIFAP